MANHELHNRALEMRLLGMSYSQIKEELGVSKSTLSVWLREYPLSRDRINELRGRSEKRIERYRETWSRKREERMRNAYDMSAKEVGELSDRELSIAGLMLYWAEGTKAARGVICMTNTDPAMLIFFIRWIQKQGVEHSRLKAKLHLYEDMDIEAQTAFWSSTLGISSEAFRKPYIKASSFEKRRNYKGRFGHGTCNVFVNDIALYEKVMSGIDYIRNTYGASSIL